MNINRIRGAVKAHIEPLGLRVYHFVPDSPNPPCVIVQPDGEPFVNYHEAMGGGLVSLQFTLLLAVGAVNDENAQARLDEYLSAGADAPDSIIDALETDKTLGGVVADCTVHTGDAYGPVQLAVEGPRYLGAELHLTIYQPRTLDA